MSVYKQYYSNIAQKLIKNLEKRNMEGYYCSTKEEALQKILSLIQDHSSVTWGGSMTLSELGIIDKLHENKTLTLYDRSRVPSEEVPSIYLSAFSSDYYLMSTNAITRDGKLINIDGTGNRVAALIYGPKNVIVVAGINKVAEDEADGILRVRNVAAPLNTVRLQKNTPCTVDGACHDCLSDDCICMHTVITRNSRDKNRIKVVIVGEHLGY